MLTLSLTKMRVTGFVTHPQPNFPLTTMKCHLQCETLMFLISLCDFKATQRNERKQY